MGQNEVVLDGEMSLLNQLDGEAGVVIEVEHGTGIDTIVCNSDYTLTFNMTNGETFTTGSIRGEQGAQGPKGEQGDDYTLTEQDKQDIADMVDTPVDDVQINGTSIVENGVANVPTANSSTLGVVKIGAGLVKGNNDKLNLYTTNDGFYKSGFEANAVIINKQHLATFYGLAKAAGHDEKKSTLPVGQYTEEAKAAIRAMLGISEVVTVNVEGSTPVITAEANHRYICGEVTSLGFTPCESGICDVIFTSGETAAVVTLPETVKFPSVLNIGANKTYEINILDGVYGAVMAWT